MKRPRFQWSTTHVILLSFLGAVLVGTLLLMLPISSSSRQFTPFVDALFTATTATCVTGLVVVPTATAWSFFGQLVILILIQVGGLGVITVFSGIAIFLNRRMGLSDRLLLQDAFNLNTLSGLGHFVRRVIRGTLTVEGIGAALYMVAFVPKYGLRGIWISLFNAVSAFCNAGMDVIGENSLCDYAADPWVNAITCALIVLGGLGYIVWWDVVRVLREEKSKRSPWSRLTLHSKIALSATVALLLGGGLLIYLFERSNPETLGGMSFWGGVQASLFQSVTARTAGFATVSQAALTNESSIVMMLLMFIGGSPVGTAGGVKTVTFAVLIATAVSAVRNRRSVTLFNRTISPESVQKAVGVVVSSFAILFLSTVALSAVCDAPLLDLLYETVSATATVGLSRDLTASLNTAGKLIIAATMYFGRVGPITMAIAFGLKKENQNLIQNPTEAISVG
ncbi:MAG: potassium transporter KtrB [Ruminococcaceae bacterium]|nr:potassium transporter KtrB [Oscillospiraceae bacterium]